MNTDKLKRVQRPRRIRGAGSVFQKGSNETWVIQYYRDDPATGKRIRTREYTGLRSRAEAQQRLNTRLYQIDRGEQFETRRQRAVTVADLYDALKLHTENNNSSERGAEGLGWRWKHLEPVFGNMLVANVTTDAIEKYKSQRRDEGAAPATINRELATLRRAFNLGKRSTPPKVRSTPYFQMLKEDNARQGFVEHDAFARMTAVAVELWLRLLLEMAYTYGWRRGELLGLRVRQVDFLNRTMRLETGTTKNGEGREVTMTTKVEELLRAAVHGKKPNDPVFTRDDGKPVRDFRGAWAILCVQAGVGAWVCSKCDAPLPTGAKCQADVKGGGKCGGERRYKGLIVHDFRRSAAKAARRAGVPESVIMGMGGWKTPSMFRRYAIVSSADQHAAVEMLEKARALESSVSPRSAPFSDVADFGIGLSNKPSVQ